MEHQHLNSASPTIDTEISFTLITRSDGVLSKTIRPDGEGGIIKTPAAQMARSAMQRVNIPFHELGSNLRKLNPHQAFAHGVPIEHNGDDYQEFTVGLSGQEDPPRQLSRSKKHLGYPQDSACLAMFDHDPKPGQKPLSVEKFISAIIEVAPDFADYPTWHTPSTSACIYDLKGNQLKSESDGFHLYFPYTNPDTLKSFTDTLFKRLWLAGHGYIFISKSGTMHERTIFDAAVFSPVFRVGTEVRHA